MDSETPLSQGGTENKAIQRLDKSSVHQIVASQVVIDLRGCIKELLDNSLDAGATSIGTFPSIFMSPFYLYHSIDIVIVNYGTELVEVRDNGCGIKKEDYGNIAIRSATSKIRNFEDINDNLVTLGFRVSPSSPLLFYHVSFDCLILLG